MTQVSRVGIFLKAVALLVLLSVGTRSVSGQERPNVLIAIADDWSYGHASAYGCAWVETPNFDRVAREGLLFHNAYTPNAKCAPSRAILLTGRYSWQLEEAANHVAYFPPKFGSFVEVLSANGYATGFTGKGWGPGQANDTQGRPRKITGTQFADRKAAPPTSQISNNDYAANFEDFLYSSDGDQPWCFWFGTLEPHRAYEFQSGAAAGKSIESIDRVPSYWPDTETVRHDLLDYALEVEHYDTHLGRILGLLERRGELENTIIICTSDHGMPFPRVKGQAYMVSNHVPLAVRWPKGIVNAGRELQSFVSFADVAPTVLEAAGVTETAPWMQAMSGRSMLDLFRGEEDLSVRDHVLIGKERHDLGRPDDVGYPIRGILTADWLYLRNYETDRWPAGNPITGYLNCDGGATKTEILEMRRSGASAGWWQLCFGKRLAEEIYAVKDDPDCVKNLIGTQRGRSEADALQDRMVEELTEQGDPRMLGNGDVFDRYPYANSQAGFYSRWLSGEELKAGWVNPSDFETTDLEELGANAE